MPEPTFTVLYDGGCPLCSREIDHYRRLAGGLPIRWVDVTLPATDLGSYGVSLEDVLRRFHVIDGSGTVHTGARAFIALWAELPRYRRLARFCRTLRLAPVLEACYRRFADWHYVRRCRDGVCGTNGEAAP